MDAEEKQEICTLLEKTDASLVFLGLLVLATGLSWRATAIQRAGLCRLLEGQEGEIPNVFFQRLIVSAVAVGATVYFFALALDNCRTVRNQGEAACRSAERNVWASLLVLAAALVRLYDMNQIRALSPALEEKTVPE